MGKETSTAEASIEAPADAGGAVVNFPAPAGGAAKPSFEMIGPAPLGKRCVVCNIVGLSRQLIRHDGQVDVMHPACAKTALKPKEASPVTRFPTPVMNDGRN